MPAVFLKQTFADRSSADTAGPRWSLKGRIMKRLYKHLLGVDLDNDPTMKKVQVTFAVKTEPSRAQFHFRDATRPAVVAITDPHGSRATGRSPAPVGS